MKLWKQRNGIDSFNKINGLESEHNGDLLMEIDGYIIHEIESFLIEEEDDFKKLESGDIIKLPSGATLVYTERMINGSIISYNILDDMGDRYRFNIGRFRNSLVKRKYNISQIYPKIIGYYKRTDWTIVDVVEIIKETIINILDGYINYNDDRVYYQLGRLVVYLIIDSLKNCEQKQFEVEEYFSSNRGVYTKDEDTIISLYLSLIKNLHLYCYGDPKQKMKNIMDMIDETRMITIQLQKESDQNIHIGDCVDIYLKSRSN